MVQWWRICPSKQETQETRVRSWGREDPLEKEMAPHSSTLAWRISWTEEPGQATVHGVTKSDVTEHTHTHSHKVQIDQTLSMLLKVRLWLSLGGSNHVVLQWFVHGPGKVLFIELSAGYSGETSVKIHWVKLMIFVTLFCKYQEKFTKTKKNQLSKVFRRG